MNLRTFIKRNIKYVVLFVFFFLCLQFFYVRFQGDLVYNYGFSYAVSRGEIPYKDFNMIIPPFGAFLYAIPLLIFGSELAIYNLFQALLLSILFYFLFKLFGKKAYLFLAIFASVLPFPFVTGLFGGYNFLLLLEMIILLYLEKNKGNDYAIGCLLGLCMLTKQTVGFCLSLVSIYYLFTDHKKVLKRIAGFCIPCFIFLIYLIVTDSFVQFFDLCLFGMLDFTSSNGTIMDYNFILFITGLLMVFYLILKEKGNIRNYYVLAFSLVSVPLFDYYHVSLFIFSLLILFIDKLKIKYKSFILGLNCFMFALAMALTWFGLSYEFKPNFGDFRGFKFMIMSKKVERETRNINDFIEEHKDKNLIILGANAYFFKIVNDMDINYYDLLNYGNHGYDGTNKMIKRVKEEDNPIFIINIKEYEDKSSKRQQINKNVMEYVIANYQIVEQIGEYVVYGGV